MAVNKKFKRMSVIGMLWLMVSLLGILLAAGGRTGAQDLDTRYKLALSSMRPHIISFTVANVEESSKWYIEKLGFKLFKKINVPKRQLKMRFLTHNNGFMLELVEIKGSFPIKQYVPDLKKRYMLRGVYKFGFWVSDLDAVYQKLKGMGVTMRQDKPMEDKPFNSRHMLIEDIDGNTIQIFEDLK